MMRILGTVPKNALIGFAALLGAIVLFGILWPTLGAARDGAVQENARLSGEIQQVSAAITSAESDQKYVADNLAAFESLMKSDRLIPHTRRTAVIRLQESARLNGIVAGWSFNAAPADSAQAVAAQPASAAYRLSVEEVNLKVSAPSDGAVYSFVDDVNATFPGALVVSVVRLKRAPAITDADLRAISEGRDSALVAGEVQFIWRTAQAMEQPK